MKSVHAPAQMVVSLVLAAVVESTNAFTIGHYDLNMDPTGLAGTYISAARQSLIDKGYVLTATSVMDPGFLSTVDAVYIGLLTTAPTLAEMSALRDFVNAQGGFLFVQTDWSPAYWSDPANAVLANWGIATTGNLANDSGHATVGTSAWVSTPDAVTGFFGSAHSGVTSAPADFAALARDNAGNIILGVLDTGGTRSSDVLVATDINFWNDFDGWPYLDNQHLWSNIWQFAATQTGNGSNDIPEPSALGLLGPVLLCVILSRRCQIKNPA